MNLVIDSNVLFACIIKDSLTRRILLHLDAKFFVLSTNFEEISKYHDLILKKAKISQTTFDLILSQLLERCILVEDKALLNKMPQAQLIMAKIDIADSTFIAAALATGADIWSDDGHFLKQDKVKVWKTSDLQKLLYGK